MDQEYNVRLLKTSDFFEIQSWSSYWSPGVLNPELFPKTTFIIEGLAVWSLYPTGTGIAYMDNFLANPKVEHNQALDYLIEFVANYAKSQGIKFLISYTAYDKVAARARAHGFTVAEQPLKQLGRSLCHLQD